MAITAQQLREAAVSMAAADASLQTISKTDLIAAASAADAWCDANQASYVAALPQPFRGASNAQQKSLLLAVVVMRRGGVVAAP